MERGSAPVLSTPERVFRRTCDPSDFSHGHDSACSPFASPFSSFQLGQMHQQHAGVDKLPQLWEKLLRWWRAARVSVSYDDDMLSSLDHVCRFLLYGMSRVLVFICCLTVF